MTQANKTSLGNSYVELISATGANFLLQNVGNIYAAIAVGTATPAANSPHIVLQPGEMASRQTFGFVNGKIYGRSLHTVEPALLSISE